jgi:acyl-homoserine lactone acylase PvdQ
VRMRGSRRGWIRWLGRLLPAGMFVGFLLIAGSAEAVTLPPIPGLPLGGLPHYVQPYGTDDAGGFYNVLPPGEAGTDNAVELAQYEATGKIPSNFEDQQPLYDNLLYAAPRLTSGQIPAYFKDATFGTRSKDIARVEQPESGLTIVRDRYDVPHIYGQTRAEVEYGAGYAAAEDRLFLMDVLRHVSEASLSSFVGGSAGDRAMDEAQWTVAPYTTGDLQQQVNNASRLYGAAGAQVVADVKSYVAGINAYISKALIDPQLLPAEYAAIGKTPTQWKPTDVIALASLIGAIFGKGGGNEVQSALALEAFEKRFGVKSGRRAWQGFREANDPQAPTTVSRAFPYETGSPFAKRGLAMPVAGTVRYVSPGAVNPDTAQVQRAPTRKPASAARRRPSGKLAAGQTGAPPGSSGVTATPDPLTIPDDGSIGSALLEDLYGKTPLASNWELVNARHSTTVMGPQVGYYFPQILMEEDLHGPGLVSRGASFPGVNLYVELGHGPDYAWSATTATSDNVDTFAEVLCNPRGGATSPNSTYYSYRGHCLAMQKLVRTNSWTPNADDSTPPGSQTLTTYRTVHGLVFARGRVGRRWVAFVSDRTTYFHEADSAVGFMQLNDPSYVTGPRRFQQAASHINFGFNWAYVNANHIAYFQSGWYPRRAPGTSPDFPILGTGRYDWRGVNNTLHTESDIPFSAHPQALDPTDLVSWNNKQAPRWAAADDNYGYGALYRMQLIRDHMSADMAHNHGRMNIGQLVQAMDLAATEDIRIVKLWPLLRKVLGRPSNARLRSAISRLNTWYRDGGHRWDLKRSGTYANNLAIETMDAWWPKLLVSEFLPTLRKPAFNRLQDVLGYGSENIDTTPNPPDFAQGWYGFVDKDLSDLLHQHNRHRYRKPRGAYSRIYCGRGSFKRCRTALRSSLRSALSVSPKTMYGHGICAKNPQPSCYDQNTFTVVSAITPAPFPFQNRPTFQQVVELSRTLPR